MEKIHFRIQGIIQRKMCVYCRTSIYVCTGVPSETDTSVALLLSIKKIKELFEIKMT